MPGKEQDQNLNAVYRSVAIPLLIQAHCCLSTARIYIILIFEKMGGVELCKKPKAFASRLSVCMHV